MRAAFVPELRPQESIILTGDVSHHLVNVVRIEENEELLLLNGKGLSLLTRVKSVSKKALECSVISTTQHEITRPMDLALGVPKKEALELSLKQAVELGFRRIFLIRSAYSQIRIPEESRLRSLLVSAVEQANNPFLPELIETTWEALPWNEFGTALWLNSQGSVNPLTIHEGPRPKLLIVGPEGGFSPEEESFFATLPVIQGIKLPTPILRTPTAVATGAGILLRD